MVLELIPLDSDILGFYQVNYEKVKGRRI